MHIGIFGGSYNPIHNGHIAIAQQVVQRTTIDEVWLMVTPHNPFKEHTDLMDDALRLRLASAATEGIKGLKCSDFEFRLPRPSYMWNTLQELSKAYPEHDFSLVIGADNWLCFNRWYHSEDILAHHNVIVYPRPGYNINVESMPSNVHFLDIELYDISSTEIRQRLQQGESIAELVPKVVAEELNTNL